MTSKEIRIISLLVLDTMFFLLEAVIGYTVHSLALVADSFHMLNDIISLFIALWAVQVKNTKPADGKYTYGWQRAEILGALINAVFLLALCFTIVIEAIQRLVSPPEISNAKLILIVGFAGLLSNFVGLVLFHEHGHSHSHGGSGESGHSHTSNVDLESGTAHTHLHGEVETSGTNSSKPGSESDENLPLLDSSRNQSSGDIRQYMPENFISSLGGSSRRTYGGANEEDEDEEEEPGKPKVTKTKSKGHKKKSMNMEGVFLHVLGDALGNIGVIISALIIWKTDWPGKYYSDPIISLVITVIIFSSALPLCKKSSKILLQATPTNIDSNQVVKEIIKLDSIKSIHDFHIWNLNEDILIASLHIQLDDRYTNNETEFEKKKFIGIVTQVRELLHGFNIHSATIQPEFSSQSVRFPGNVNGDQSPVHLNLNGHANNQPPASPSNSKNSQYTKAFGETSELNCSVDNASGCFNENCLNHQ